MESRTKDIETLDTCFILRLMLNDVTDQTERALKRLKMEGVRYFIPEAAVTEAVYVMEGKGLSRKNIVEGLRELLTLKKICSGMGIFQGVFDLYLAHPKLSFVDCYLAVQTGVQETTPLWTFDKKLASQTEEAKLA